MSMLRSSEGKALWILLLCVVFMVGGVAIGLFTPVGSQVNKIYQTFRFRNAPVAKDFLPKPFGLKIVYVQDAEGLKTYLFNDAKHEMLPIYEIEGETQVGDAAHRLKGLGEETRSKVLKMLEDAQKGSSSALDKMKKLLEGLGK